MELYLPVAEMSVNWAMILGMGAAVGFLSGMFGVGGGFLMTPLLVFYGIPPGIAVATQASHITAASLSGALTQWRRQAVDFKMGVMLLTGGIAGSVLGVYVFRLLRELGQIELVVSGSYVVLLGSIGGLMLNESIRTIRAARSGTAPPPVKLHQHSWIHGLPLKMRFRRSKLYISVIPPVVLGILVGVLTAIMGVGGGFIMIPAMIYLLKMPTNIVVGTSQFQILSVTAAATSPENAPGSRRWLRPCCSRQRPLPQTISSPGFRPTSFRSLRISPGPTSSFLAPSNPPKRRDRPGTRTWWWSFADPISK